MVLAALLVCVCARSVLLEVATAVHARRISTVLTALCTAVGTLLAAVVARVHPLASAYVMAGTVVSIVGLASLAGTVMSAMLPATQTPRAAPAACADWMASACASTQN